MMLSEALVFGSSELFEVTAFQHTDQEVTISVQSRLKECPCPRCNIHSRTLHSFYYRTVKDLPAFGHMVFLKLKARKWYCKNPDCIRKVFTERFNHFFECYKRTSSRLRDKLLKIAVLVGGNPGAKLCHTLQLSVSSSTLIRLTSQQQFVTDGSFFEAIGIDDWAFKKGVKYGTAIVNLHQHKVVDLLPDRETATLENWLDNHPEVTVITRDRFNRYALAATNSLPHAAQVADRWHLLKNMGDALKKLLERKRQQIIALQSEEAIQMQEKDQQEKALAPQEEKLSPRHSLLQTVKTMYAAGNSIRTISRTLGISRNTVKKYTILHEPPQKKGVTSTNLVSFSEYLRARIDQDPKVETLQLYAEIKAMGYNGGRTILYGYLKKYGKQTNRTRRLPLPEVTWTTAKVKVLLCKKEDKLAEKDKKLVKDLCDKSPEISQARVLAIKFREMMEDKHGHLLSSWITEVEQSCIQEMKGFARGLLSDYQAVVNALTLSWSNGQVEGQINKLKTIKRQMYGRAGFNLLKKCVILHSAYYHQN